MWIRCLPLKILPNKRVHKKFPKPLLSHYTQILLYVGTKSCKWVNPAKLASYDIILTDYETLRSEFDYSGRNTSDRVLRNKSSTIKRKSPLLNLNFWRLCLDESQMVINMQSKHAQMISALSAVNRWAVTGTPIERALDDLFGLISFINYAPYNQRTRWSEIENHLNYRSNFEPLVSILQPIMRRTCKSESIMNEMSVPRQVEQVHYVHLSGLNRYHYNQERDNCRQMFNQLISSQHLDTPLSNFSPQSLERVRILHQSASTMAKISPSPTRCNQIRFTSPISDNGTCTNAAPNLYHSSLFG